MAYGWEWEEVRTVFAENLEEFVEDGGEGLLFSWVFLFKCLRRFDNFDHVSFNAGKGNCGGIFWAG